MGVVLAMDTSGRTAGVCLLEEGRVLFEETLPAGLTHSETMLPLVARALNSAGLCVGDVAVIGLSAGPGSFTGLRIGLALAKGLALPWGTSLAPVSTLRALAVAAQGAGRVVCALDARRGEVYWAAFENAKGRPRRLTPDAAGPVGDIGEMPGFEKGKTRFVGDGAELCYNAYNYSPQERPAPRAGGHGIAWGAAVLAGAMLENGTAQPCEKARCRYVRLSQFTRSI